MVAVIDGDWLPFVACYIKPEKDGTIKDRSLEECYSYCDSLITNIFKDTKATEYIIALTKGKCFRYKIYPDYKGNRKYKQELKYFKEVKQYVIDKWKAVYFEELEADDIVNICRLNIKDSFIVSTDKDLTGLEGLHYNPKLKSWITTSKNQAAFDFATDMIVGQPGDNIKGIPGRGQVYAQNVLCNKYGSENLLETILGSYLNNYTSKVEAIDEFYKNFKCLTIVENWEGFSIPEPNKVPVIEDNEFQESVVER